MRDRLEDLIFIFIIALALSFLIFGCTGLHIEQVKRECDVVPVAEAIIRAHGEASKEIKLVKEKISYRGMEQW